MDWGENSASQAVGHSSRGILGWSEFYRALEELPRKQGRTGWEVGDFLTRLAGPIF